MRPSRTVSTSPEGVRSQTRRRAVPGERTDGVEPPAGAHAQLGACGTRIAPAAGVGSRRFQGNPGPFLRDRAFLDSAVKARASASEQPQRQPAQPGAPPLVTLAFYSLPRLGPGKDLEHVLASILD